MTTTLVPAVIETAIKPKPTKDEILTAMARLHVEKLTAENIVRKKTQAELMEKIKVALVKHAKSIKDDLEPQVWFNNYNGKPDANVSFRFSTSQIPKEILAMIRLHESNHVYCVPCLSEAKKQVRKAMGELVSKDARVDALLADERSRKALEKALEKLDSK